MMNVGDFWSQMVNASGNSTVSYTVVINPSNGPGDTAEEAYATGITDLVNAGVEVGGWEGGRVGGCVHKTPVMLLMLLRCAAGRTLLLSLFATRDGLLFLFFSPPIYRTVFFFKYLLVSMTEPLCCSVVKKRV